MPPRRGWIIDRNKVPIAINRSSFRIDLIPQQLETPEATLKTLAELLQLTSDDMDRILRELKQGHGFQAVQVAENVTFDQYASITVRLPDLPGVQATRGFSRYYPDGPAVAHLLGYVGTANQKEYEAEDKNPLLIIPGVKIGKQGLEKTLEPYLRGTPGGQRVEVTARGKLVKELDPKPDRSGQTVQLTIDQGLQQYAARRMGDQSGALVAMDVANGDLLAFVSIPAFDPNSFSEGIGRTEWKMLSENDHIPLLNKVAQGLYPSGSTIKPAMALAFLKQGVDPDRRVHCAGGYQIGNRYFRCDAVHGSMDMHSAIERSCNTYFWATGLITDPAQTTEMVNYLGYGQEFDLPIPSQRFGTMPNPKWLEEVSPKVAGLRFREHVDRPGVCSRKPAPVGGHAGAFGIRKAASAAAADDGARGARQARRCHSGATGDHSEGNGGCGQRQRYRRRVEAAARRSSDGGEDRYRPSLPAR